MSDWFRLGNTWIAIDANIRSVVLPADNLTGTPMTTLHHQKALRKAEPAISYFLEQDAGKRILTRCNELAAISEPSQGVTRLFLTNEHRSAIDLVAGWMREAGMEVETDAAGNVVGRYPSASGSGPYLMIGSHIDSVIDAGRFDGPLGVICAIDCVASLNRDARRLPFGIEVLAFGDEEGTRFGTTLIGSRAVAGTLEQKDLAATDKNGISVAQALKSFGLEPQAVTARGHDPKDVLGYVEVHIEQGPVLEQANLPVGVVTAISGQLRKLVTLRGQANHAGTVPMRLRHDPFLAGAEIALAVEQIASALPNAVGTVGQIEVRPGASNVIPGHVTLSLDLRAQTDIALREMEAQISAETSRIAKGRGVAVQVETLLEMPPSPCAPWLVEQIGRAVQSCGYKQMFLPSGAGHDGMAMIALTSIGMLFVRCKAGISHSPLESVEVEDVTAAAAVLRRFVENFDPNSVS
jgi:allantoate deiminase